MLNAGVITDIISLFCRKSIAAFSRAAAPCVCLSHEASHAVTRRGRREGGVRGFT